jgi:hypothetical protein
MGRSVWRATLTTLRVIVIHPHPYTRKWEAPPQTLDGCPGAAIWVPPLSTIGNKNQRIYFVVGLVVEVDEVVVVTPSGLPQEWS